MTRYDTHEHARTLRRKVKQKKEVPENCAGAETNASIVLRANTFHQCGQIFPRTTRVPKLLRVATDYSSPNTRSIYRMARRINYYLNVSSIHKLHVARANEHATKDCEAGAMNHGETTGELGGFVDSPLSLLPFGGRFCSRRGWTMTDRLTRRRRRLWQRQRYEEVCKRSLSCSLIVVGDLPQRRHAAVSTM